MAPPFKHHVKTSPYLELENPFTVVEALKLVLLFPLIIFRLVCIAVLLAILAAVSSIASLGADLSRPFPTWRRAIVHTLRPLAKLIVICLGFSVHLKGWENYQDALKRDLKLVVFNHPGWVDPAIVLYLFAPSGVSREANTRIPVVGTIIKSFQNINVPSSDRRSRPSSRNSTDSPSATLVPRSTTALIGQRLAQDGWPLTVIAPEGMTHNGKQVLKFKSGAFVFGAPVLPVCISYEHKPLNPAWTIQSEPWHLLRMLSQPWTTAYVNILPMYVPSSAERNDAQLYAENVRTLMAEAMGVPISPIGMEQYKHVLNAGITVDWRGRISAPEGVIDSEGCIVAASPQQQRFGESPNSSTPSSPSRI